MERRMFIRWVGYLLDRTREEIIEDKELMDYIFKYDLRQGGIYVNILLSKNYQI